MKRKFILILAVLLFCSGIYIVAKGLQNRSISESQNEHQGEVTASQKTEENNKPVIKTENSKNENSNNNQTGQKSDNQTKAAAANSGNNVTKQPGAAVNFKVIDTVNNKTILSTSADLENRTVGEVTTRILDSKGVSYRAQGALDSIYFSSIAGLTERKAGPESGWCYYVNGVKRSIGAGGYKLKKGDIVEWKYLKDGISK